MRKTVSGRAKIIQENNVINPQFPPKMMRINNPRQVGRAHNVVNHRASNAKSSRNNAFALQIRSGLPRKLLHNKIELRKLLAGKALLEDGRQLSVFLREKRKIALGAAHIACKDHPDLPMFRLNSILKRFF